METQEKLYMTSSRTKQIMRIPLCRLKMRSKQEKVVNGGLKYGTSDGKYLMEPLDAKHTRKSCKLWVQQIRNEQRKTPYGTLR